MASPRPSAPTSETTSIARDKNSDTGRRGAAAAEDERVGLGMGLAHHGSSGRGSPNQNSVETDEAMADLCTEITSRPRTAAGILIALTSIPSAARLSTTRVEH